MGRHSTDASWPFVRSVVAWALPWALAVVLVAAALWSAVTMLGTDGNADIAVAPSPTPSSPEPSPSPTLPVPAETSPEPSPSPRRRRGTGNGISFEGTTAQVLNGTGVTGAAERMADRLARMGFQVVAIDDALGRFDRTLIYWTSASSQRQAEALAGANGWLARPKPENLAETVEVHVVVGADEAH